MTTVEIKPSHCLFVWVSASFVSWWEVRRVDQFIRWYLMFIDNLSVILKYSIAVLLLASGLAGWVCVCEVSFRSSKAVGGFVQWWSGAVQNDTLKAEEKAELNAYMYLQQNAFWWRQQHTRCTVKLPACTDAWKSYFFSTVVVVVRGYMMKPGSVQALNKWLCLRAEFFHTSDHV